MASAPVAQTRVQAPEAQPHAAQAPPAESFALPEGMLATLAALAPGATVAVERFPIAPGVRAPLTLRRTSVYAPGARLWAVTGDARRPVPRTTRLHFVGTSERDPSLRLALSFDPRGGTVRGLVHGGRGTFEIAEPEGGGELHRLHSAEAEPGLLRSACGTDSLRHPGSDFLFEPGTTAGGLAQGALTEGTATREAVIAVDSDNEWLHLKFANSTAAATDWIADLFVEMNVMYERDLSLRLLQGDTFLRIDPDVIPTYDDDPWTVTGSPAGNSHLGEFGGWWSVNQGAVARTFAMLLSGKSDSAFSSSGIAWVDGYCETQSTGGGYSVTQTFGAGIGVINDVRVIAHEIGHNLGSPHTHCYSPPVDECYNAQGGCYAGPESCPPGGTGTMMSYCHFSTHANCGANLVELHPTVIALMDGLVTAHTPFCIAVVDGVFADGFESGGTSAWSLVVP